VVGAAFRVCEDEQVLEMLALLVALQ